MLKKIGIYGLWLVGVVTGSVLLGTLLLATVYNIPAEQWTEEHMRAAANTLSAEGVYPDITSRATSRLDNYTDSIMLLNAAYSGTGSVFEQAMRVESNGIEGMEPQDIIAEHYANGQDFDEVSEYNRYWHGYLVVLKPLLAAFSYKKIRVINAVVQVSLVAVTIFVMVKRKKKYLIAPLLILWAFLMPLALMKSLQFSSCFYIMMLGILALVWIKELTMRKAGFVFLGIGILLAFLDLLTYPLITFGVPVAVYLLIKDEKKVGKQLVKFVFAGGCWLIGYMGMWIGKWVIGSLILGRELFSDAIEQLLFRTSVTGEQYEKMEVINNNFESFFHTPAVTALLIYVAVMITLIVVYWINQKRKNKKIVKDMIFAILPFLVVMIVPIVWFLAVSNHSYHHYWFTNKILGVMIFAGMCGLTRIYLDLKSTAKIR